MAHTKKNLFTELNSALVAEGFDSMQRKMFAGGNTPNGFHSFFEFICPVKKAKRRLFLKGASGSGKSTFIKKAVKAFEENGCDIDIIRCSNDAESLDGIYVEQYGLSIVDATAPHVCEPVVLSAVDRIIDFTPLLDEQKIAVCRDEILEISETKKIILEKAYSYIKAAEALYSINRQIYEKSQNKIELYKLNKTLLEVFDGISVKNTEGSNRRLFSSAITPDGIVNFTSDILTGVEVCAIAAETGQGAETILSNIQKEANIRGLDTESFYCPMDVNKTEHLVIPELGMAYTTINSFSKNINIPSFIDFSEYSKITSQKNEIDENIFLIHTLLDKAMKNFKMSREIHDRIEKIYSSSMDFEKLNISSSDIINNIIRGGVWH